MIDWTIHYIKNRNLIRRDLENIEKDKEGFDLMVKFTDKKQAFIIIPQLSSFEEFAARINETDNFGLVVLNTTKNFGIIVDNWEKLIKFRSLTLYFVNPFSEQDKKWVINPYVHSRVCDENSLKTGLKSMFDMVDPLTDQEIISKFI